MAFFADQSPLPGAGLFPTLKHKQQVRNKVYQAQGIVTTVPQMHAVED